MLQNENIYIEEIVILEQYINTYMQYINLANTILRSWQLYHFRQIKKQVKLKGEARFELD